MTCISVHIKRVGATGSPKVSLIGEMANPIVSRVGAIEGPKVSLIGEMANPVVSRVGEMANPVVSRVTDALSVCVHIICSANSDVRYLRVTPETHWLTPWEIEMFTVESNVDWVVE